MHRKAVIGTGKKSGGVTKEDGEKRQGALRSETQGKYNISPSFPNWHRERDSVAVKEIRILGGGMQEQVKRDEQRLMRKVWARSTANYEI